MKELCLTDFFYYPLSVELQKEIQNLVNKISRVPVNVDEINDILNKTAGFNLISTEENCGGFCSVNTKEIALQKRFILNEELNYQPFSIIIHELMHVIQNKTGYYYLLEGNLLDAFKLEQQAELMTFYTENLLYKKFFDLQLSANKFIEETPYFYVYGFEFLKDWYEEHDTLEDYFVFNNGLYVLKQRDLLE